MINYSEMKAKLENREKTVFTTMTFFNEPMLIKEMINDDLDFVLFDMEHGRYNTENLIPYLYMCRTLGMPSIVRVQDALYHLIAKTIDMGADGIMLPRVETLEQIKIAIDGMRFAPIGRKGIGGAQQFRAGESFDELQCGRHLIIQIESPKGIEMLPEMLKVYGDQISGVIVGPYDLSAMVGSPFKLYCDDVQNNIKKVIATANAAGKSVGVYCNGPDDANRYRALGANLLWVASDLGFFARGLDEIMKEMSEIK